MSGIAGIFHCGTIKPVDPARIERMCSALAHRGADDSGIWTAPGVGLGCGRLAILDRARSVQPMRSMDGRAVLALDGQIYNFRELRRELTALGTEVRADGDGEVIFAAWQRWGVDCLPRLHGEFAFALYDAEARTLLLARDRLGVKPLLMASLSDGSLAFASELKGLLAHPMLRREADLLAIEDYLARGYVPDSRSILKGVEKLPAGHYRLMRHGRAPAGSVQWWQASFAGRLRGSQRDLEAELLHHLREAVTSRMKAEAAPGALLSGGVGSSSVVAFMAEASRAPVRTYAVGVEGLSGDETARASKAAGLLGADHFECSVGSGQLTAIDALATLFDEPFADASALATWRLCQFAREGVTVALSGEGADEIFAGARRHELIRRHERLRALLPAGFLEPVSGALGKDLPGTGWTPGFLRGWRALQALADSGAEGYARHRSVVSPELRRLLYAPELARELASYRAEQPLNSLIDGAPARSGLDRAQYADLTFSLPASALTRLDRTSMAAGLEVRAPLLDHRLVEFAAALPERMRVRGGRGKRLLTKAMRRYLPDDVLKRREPAVDLPMAEWLRGPLARETQAIGVSAALARTGWFDTSLVVRMAEAHRAGRADHSRLLWQLLVLDRSLIHLGVIS